MDGYIALVQRLTGWRHFPLVASLVLIAGFMVAFYWRDMFRGAMCTGAETEHCARDWIAATGGWIAIVFAYFTIRKMTQQTAEANRHQKENLELQLSIKLNSAKRAKAGCVKGIRICMTICDRIEHHLNTGDLQQLRPRFYVPFIFGSLHERDLAELNSVIEHSELSISDMTGWIMSRVNEFEAGMSADNETAAQTAMLQMIKSAHKIADHLQTYLDAMDAFINRWQPRISPD
jgi:hypothetical protein